MVPPTKQRSPVPYFCYLQENRDAPRFEKQRDHTSRFFGQGPGDDNEVTLNAYSILLNKVIHLFF